MNPVPSNAEWARAYHGQAKSDFAVFNVLSNSDVPRCHALQHLQMASEKAAKAYRLAGDDKLDPELLHTHVVTRAFVRAFLRRPEVIKRWAVSGYAVDAERQRVETIAASVEKLAPTADSAQQPRNAENPWVVANQVVAPVQEPFADLGSGSADLVRYLTVLRLALEEFDALA